MKHTYITPSSTLYAFEAATLLAASPTRGDKMGMVDQFSTGRTDWEAPEWAADEE